MGEVKRLSLGFPPSETQKKLYESRARHTGFGGARGGGKSHGLRTKVVMLCYEYPGIRCMIVRQTYP